MPPDTLASKDMALSAKDLRVLAAAKLRPNPASTNESRAFGSDYDLNPDLLAASTDGLKRAAVLVPILARQPLSVLLTVRTAHLAAHAGQIAFPGGKIEADDEGPLDAALREAREEIGLSTDAVEPLGYLDPYRTGTGYLITPVVGLIVADSPLAPDPAEVEDVFEVPFAFLMSEANHRIDSRLWRGAERRFYAMPYEQRYIWGATAGIIRMLYRNLFST